QKSHLDCRASSSQIAALYKQIKFARVETVSSGSVDIVVADMVVRVGGDFDPGQMIRFPEIRF
ncbi:hypothetical protein JL39_23695, partial [Rhizobium sp. YS-1r]